MVKPDTQTYIEQMRAARDIKVYEHLLQYAPLWMPEDEPEPAKDKLHFKIIFYHPEYGWVSRRYWYDAFTDVLYQNGQLTLDENVALDYQTAEPYLDAEGGNSMSSYGG